MGRRRSRSGCLTPGRGSSSTTVTDLRDANVVVVFLIPDKTRTRGEKVSRCGWMRDKELPEQLKLEDSKNSHARHCFESPSPLHFSISFFFFFFLESLLHFSIFGFWYQKEEKEKGNGKIQRRWTFKTEENSSWPGNRRNLRNDKKKSQDLFRISSMVNSFQYIFSTPSILWWGYRK